MRSFLIGIDLFLEIYCWILVALATLQVLRGFKVIDLGMGPLVGINNFLEKATAATLWPLRKILPPSGVDISPVLLILILMAARYAIALYALPKYI
jgi:uncharacterized protein YggT (Ycf19 family)